VVCAHGQFEGKGHFITQKDWGKRLGQKKTEKKIGKELKPRLDDWESDSNILLKQNYAFLFKGVKRILPFWAIDPVPNQLFITREIYSH
jgi:hypothetical protein